MLNVADYGDAPTFIATGVCRLFLMSPHIIRVTFVRTDRRYDGIEEQRVSGHIDMDITQIVIMNSTILEALAKLLPEGVTAPKRRHVPGSTAVH